MNKQEYLSQLAYLLQDMPEQEKSDVLQYYEDYFAEAGEEQEESVIRTLGSPERLAAMIRDGIGSGQENSHGEYTDSGYRDERFREDGKVPEKYRKSWKEQQQSGRVLEDQRGRRNNRILLMILLVVLAVTVGPHIPGLVFVAVVFLFLKFLKDQRDHKKEN